MHLRRQRARAGAALVRALTSFFALASTLFAVARIGPRVLAPALEWARSDRSRSGVEPLALRGVEWSFASEGARRAVLHAGSMRLAARRAGPFALNAARRPFFEEVEFELFGADGERCIARAPRAAWEGDALVLEGGCSLEGAAGLERVERAVWRRGASRLEARGTSGNPGQTLASSGELR